MYSYQYEMWPFLTELHFSVSFIYLLIYLFCNPFWISTHKLHTTIIFDLVKELKNFNIDFRSFSAMTNIQVMQQLPKGHRMSCPPNCPKYLYDIMCECWKGSPADRPTFETLQWKLEEFFDMDVSSYDDASRY